MPTIRTLILCALALAVSACTNAPTSTITTQLGKTPISEFTTNTAYRSWYETGYNAYPLAANQAKFDSAVAIIKSNFTVGVHTVVMAVKPNCGCPGTQLYMPQIMKTLDAAGIPSTSVDIFVTDTHITGIDSIKAKYNITEAPTFLVLKNDAVMGRIAVQPPVGRTVEQELADFFAKP